MRSLAEQVAHEFTEELAGPGWGIVEADDEVVVFGRRLGAELWAGLGLDVSPRDYGLSLNPSVSVRHETVSALYEKFLGHEGESTVAQVGRSLSGLVCEAGERHGVRWTVETVDEIPSTVRAVRRDLERYGEPLFARHRSLDALILSMEPMARSNLDHAHLAVVYQVAGRSSDVSSALRRLDELAETDPPLLAAQTRQFLSAFRAHFDVSST